jgi:uncharacterized protein GlcG (DUF336 family)
MSTGTFTKESVTAELAEKVARAALTKASALGVAGTAVVVDEAGVLKFMLRQDGAAMITVQVAHDKAYTAAGLGIPTELLYTLNQQDPRWALGLSGIDRVSALGGGLPIVLGGRPVGALGVSGGTLDVDLEIAAAGIAAVNED